MNDQFKMKKFELNGAFDVSDMNKITENGSIGEITFYGENLTREKATDNYNKLVARDEQFWKENIETYFTDEHFREM